MKDLLLLKALILASICAVFSLIFQILFHYLRGLFCDYSNLQPVLKLKVKLKSLVGIGSICLICYIYLFFLSLPSLDEFIRIHLIKSLWVTFILGAIFYTALVIFYITIYYFIDRSVSATLLEIIASSHGLTEKEVKEIYGIGRKYIRELKGMQEGGFIVKKGEFYSNSLKGKFYVRLAKGFKNLLRLGPGG